MVKNTTWVKQKEWYGNPSLGYDCYLKWFKNPLNNNRLTKVYIFGKDDYWGACISSGANSDFSMSFWVPQNLQDAKDFTDVLYEKNRLFH